MAPAGHDASWLQSRRRKRFIAALGDNELSEREIHKRASLCFNKQTPAGAIRAGLVCGYKLRVPIELKPSVNAFSSQQRCN